MTTIEARKILMSDADFSGVGERAQQTADALCIAIDALSAQAQFEKPTTMMGLIEQITDFTCEVCYKRKESEQNGEDQDTFMDTVCSECKLTNIIG